MGGIGSFLVLCVRHALTDVSQQRFGVPYMHCGCPLPVSAYCFPSDNVTRYLHSNEGETIGQKLNRLSFMLLPRDRSLNFVKPPDRDDCLLATHPSDHNAVYVDRVSHKGREKRLSKMQKRKERDIQKMKHGKLNERVHNRDSVHGDAFFMPVPTYFGYGIPGAGCSGVAGGFGLGCVTVSGSSSLRLSFLIASCYRA